MTTIRNLTTQIAAAAAALTLSLALIGVTVSTPAPHAVTHGAAFNSEFSA
jgi:hypothetical protein